MESLRSLLHPPQSVRIVDNPPFGTRALKARVVRAFTTALAAVAIFAAGCTAGDSPTAAGRQIASQALRFDGIPLIMASTGAVVQAIVSYTPSQGATPVILGQDSLVISTDDQNFAISADVAPCVNNAVTTHTQCTVSLTLRLTRAGRLLDESVSQFPIDATTQSIQIPALSLYEVALITIAPTPFSSLEPGDANQLSVTAVDRDGTKVVGRTVLWEIVSGGVTVSSTGQLVAVTPGAARVRATSGGRTTTLALNVNQPTVASLQILPPDTAIVVGTSVQMRVATLSSTGAVLTGRAVTYTSSAPLTASVSSTGLVTGLVPGTTTIIASSTDTRTGAPVTASTTVRVGTAPPIAVDRINVALADIPSNAVGAPSIVLISTSVGSVIRNLAAAITYTPATASGWLSASLSSLTTPSMLTLQANSSSLAAGDYAADVRLTSTTDAHVPISVHVTLHVLPALRVVAAPKVVDFGSVDPSQTSAPATIVTVSSSSASTPLNGLTTRVEYTSSVTGWVVASLQSQTAAPSTQLSITPRPFGLPLGSYAARVIVSSTTSGAGPDTVNVTMVVAALGKFSGLVQSATTGQPISGATVSIRRADNTQVDAVTTASNGTFTSNSLPAGTYSVVITATGYSSVTVSSQTLDGGTNIPIKAIQTVLPVPTGAANGVISGSVRDATTNATLPTVTLELRSGANNTTGTVLATTATSTGGTYQFLAQSAGTYTIRSIKTGYASGLVTVTIPGANVTAPITFLSPGTANVAWRFVLSWGATPQDLDAHLTGPVTASTARFHIYWNSPGSASVSPFSVLDIDQISGYGPETITIAQQITGVYRYYVNNFSQEAALSTSNARVDVYQGNTLVNQFFVPQGSGTYWTVFEISDATLTPINTIGTVQPSLTLPSVNASARANSATVRASSEWFDLFPSMPLMKPARIRR